MSKLTTQHLISGIFISHAGLEFDPNVPRLHRRYITIRNCKDFPFTYRVSADTQKFKIEKPRALLAPAARADIFIRLLNPYCVKENQVDVIVVTLFEAYTEQVIAKTSIKVSIKAIADPNKINETFVNSQNEEGEKDDKENVSCNTNAKREREEGDVVKSAKKRMVLIETDDEDDSSENPLCKICEENVSSGGVICNSDICHVIVHSKCFKLFEKLVSVDRSSWKCKNCAMEDNISRLQSEVQIMVNREKQLLEKLLSTSEYTATLQKQRIADLEVKVLEAGVAMQDKSSTLNDLSD